MLEKNYLLNIGKSANEQLKYTNLIMNQISNALSEGSITSEFACELKFYVDKISNYSNTQRNNIREILSSSDNKEELAKSLDDLSIMQIIYAGHLYSSIDIGLCYDKIESRLAFEIRNFVPYIFYYATSQRIDYLHLNHASDMTIFNNTKYINEFTNNVRRTASKLSNDVCNERLTTLWFLEESTNSSLGKN